MLWGGAAVHRCDNDLVSDPASAAEVTKIAREQLFLQAPAGHYTYRTFCDVWVPSHRMRRLHVDDNRHRPRPKQ